MVSTSSPHLFFAMSFGKVLPLSSGASIPQIGLGTWLSKPNEVESAVSQSEFACMTRSLLSSVLQVEIAVKNGYRHLDLAMIYENQDEVCGTRLNMSPY